MQDMVVAAAVEVAEVVDGNKYSLENLIVITLSLW